MEPFFVVAKIIGLLGVVGWERRPHTFLHYSNVTWRSRFSFQFLRVEDCENYRRFLRVRPPEQYLVLEFRLNLHQGCSGLGTAFLHLFL